MQRKCLVLVDYHLPIDDVCKQFGSYARLIAEENQESEASGSTRTREAAARNVFEIMMMSQRVLSSRTC